MSDAKMDKTRRNLIVATGAVSAAAGVAVAVPFAWSWWPSERAKAAGAPVEADISEIAPGEMKIVEWRGKPVWIMRRTKEQLEAVTKAEMGADWGGGFLCPCHGSKFDLAGRVYKGAPAPVNLDVPPHMYLSDGRILIGEDKKGA